MFWLNFQAWFCSALEAGGEDGIFIKDSDSRRPVNISSVKKKKKKKGQKKNHNCFSRQTQRNAHGTALSGHPPAAFPQASVPRGAARPGPRPGWRAGVRGERPGRWGATLGSNGPVPAPCPFGAPCRCEHAGLSRQDGLFPLRLHDVLPGPLSLSVAKQCAVTQTTGQEEY